MFCFHYPLFLYELHRRFLRNWLDDRHARQSLNKRDEISGDKRRPPSEVVDAVRRCSAQRWDNVRTGWTTAGAKCKKGAKNNLQQKNNNNKTTDLLSCSALANTDRIDWNSATPPGAQPADGALPIFARRSFFFCCLLAFCNVAVSRSVPTSRANHLFFAAVWSSLIRKPAGVNTVRLDRWGALQLGRRRSGETTLRDFLWRVRAARRPAKTAQGYNNRRIGKSAAARVKIVASGMISQRDFHRDARFNKRRFLARISGRSKHAAISMGSLRRWKQQVCHAKSSDT